MKFWDIENKEEGDIKSCPFCGLVPEIRVVQLMDKKVFELKCRNPYCPSNIQWSKSMDEIISIWNRRQA